MSKDKDFMTTSTTYYEKSALFHGSLMIIMGTRLDTLLLGRSESQSKFIWNEMEQEVRRLDALLNKFDKNSEVAKINRQALLSPAVVSDELWAILLDCKRYHQLTLGYFDISLHDFSKVQLDVTDHTVFFTNQELQLDLSGYAKGYALEKIRSILTTHKITQAFINFGNSSVLALGTHPHGANWLVGITDPFSDKTLGTMELKDSTMSTSGNMPNHQEHIINPLTGIYSNAKKIVSISCNNAIDAEVLTTALMVTDEDKTKAIQSNFKITKCLIFNS